MLNVDYTKRVKQIKPMHAVNNGPVGARSEQTRSNFEEYKALEVPYARNHDASFFSGYGGEHSVDVHAIFPDFNKDPYNPASYDFQLTDEYTNLIYNAGTKVFYRLGSKIEHWSKKYGTLVPDDFKKWAVICEHIIRHYTEGWANGFFLDIEYWEIWNEPDGKKKNGDQPNWSGTPEQFYELYKIAARHLKKCFPDKKIGGPSLSWVDNREWLEGFMKSLVEDGEKTPLDFFSWHAYPQKTEWPVRDAQIVRDKLLEYGYTETENILNEWNYLEGWSDKFIDTIKHIIGIRGAAFAAAMMIAGQKSPLDMMMYYDARPCTFNGLFDFYTLKPLKGYYSFLMFSKIYKLQNEVMSHSDDEEIYIVAAEKDAKKAMMITYYSPDKQAEPKKIEMEICGNDVNGEWNMKILDAEKTMESSEIEVKDNKISFIMYPESVMLLEK